MPTHTRARVRIVAVVVCVSRAPPHNRRRRCAHCGNATEIPTGAPSHAAAAHFPPPPTRRGRLYKTGRALGSRRHSCEPCRTVDTRSPVYESSPRFIFFVSVTSFHVIIVVIAIIIYRHERVCACARPKTILSPVSLPSVSASHVRINLQYTLYTINRNRFDMRPAAELGPSYRVQMHVQMQQRQQYQQHQHQTGSEYDEQPVSRTYQYRKVRADCVCIF